MNRIPDIAAAALACSESLVAQWLPDGKRQSAEWIATNPTRADRTPGSFAVNLRTGIWCDFATGDKGGDLVNLLAYLRNVRQREAAALIAADLGLPFGNSHATTPARARRITPPKAKPTPAPSCPPPEGATKPAPIWNHPRHGRPSARWTYTDAQARPLSVVCRFDFPDGSKDVIPYSWTGERWRWKAALEPRPLYKLPALAQRPAEVVLVIEGEKAAHAARALIPEAVVTTWAGGGNAWHKTDWRPLKGRRVILWPDADQPGLAAMGAIRGHLLALGAERVTLPTLPPGLPTGFDAADLEPAGLGRAFALALLAGKATAPEGLCPLCWARRVAAPIGGPTCPHHQPVSK
jgi:hypothetical protein